MTKDPMDYIRVYIHQRSLSRYHV